MAAQDITQTLLNAVHALAPLIRAHADEAEQNRRLSSPVVSALAEADFFRLYTPRSLGGLEVDPLTFYRVVEAIAQIDGSTAWCVWIGSGNLPFVKTLVDSTIEEIFGRGPQVVTAGILSASGNAVVRDGGYGVSGRWPYASGCQHSAWVFTMCKVCDGDQVRMTEEGRPQLRAVFVPAPAITIQETWDVSGLAGTGSHDVVIEDVFVPEAYTFQFGPGLVPQSRHFQGPLYRYPIYASAIAPIGALALGIAQGAIDACIEFAQTKSVGPTELLREKPLFQVRLAEAVALARAARAWLYNAVEQSWETQLAGGQLTFDERTDLLLAAANATRSAAAAVDIVYTAAGPTANHRRSPLQRALRDIHALTQHIATAPPQYESAGRMLLGLQPSQWPIILW